MGQILIAPGDRMRQRRTSCRHGDFLEISFVLFYFEIIPNYVSCKIQTLNWEKFKSNVH